jgi:N4-(beta-N-acetylglucosaminyl)-L-asparaginase
MTRLKFIDMTYYILRKDGAYAGVSLWQGYSRDNPHTIAVHDGAKRSEVTTPLLEGYSQDFPEIPTVKDEVR